MERIKTIISGLEKREITAAGFVVVFLAVIVVRLFVEQFIARAVLLNFSEVIMEYVHNIYFFSILIVALWLWLGFLLKTKPQKLAVIFTWAALLVILPPILDIAKTGGEVYWSFYLLSSLADLKIQFMTVFGHLPSGIMYFGTRIAFILAIIMMSGLVYIKTKDWLRTALSAIGTYVILFALGAFPSLFGYFYYWIFEHKEISSVKSFQIAQLFGSPKPIWGLNAASLAHSFAYKLEIVFFPVLFLLLAGLFYRISPKKFWAVIQNFRYPQLIYHSGLFIIGMGLGYLSYPDSFNLNVFSLFTFFVLLLSIFLAWKASVVINDIEDVEIDKITNSTRPLPQNIFNERDYFHFGLICFFLSLLGGLTVSPVFFVLLLIYQILAFFYSAKPYRLKKFPLIATMTSSLASIFILFMGFALMSSGQTFQHMSWRITLLLFITYTLSLPIKDFKDIAGDRHEKIWTIPVIFGEKKGRLIVATGVFISFILSVFFLAELKLFFWALLFGSISFMIINSSKINSKKLPWWMLIPIVFYFLILVKIVFLDNLDKFLR
jgi:4-hydroxybenzoate polyprenyltransferase